MIKSKLSRLASLLVLLLVVFMIGGCTERSVDRAQPSISITMDTGVSAKGLAETLNQVCLTISGRDMQTIRRCLPYTGGPLTFEIDVPAGRGRLFLLEGIAVGLETEVILYAGTAVADIEAGVSVELVIPVEPVVPLIRFTPFQTEVASGGEFQVNLEAFNLPGLQSADLRFLYDVTLLTLDSIKKGSSLGETDYIVPMVGSNEPWLEVVIYDSEPLGTIVDLTGYSHLATLYFTSQVSVTQAVTQLETVPVSLMAIGEIPIPPADVYSQTAGVVIQSYVGPSVRLTPGLVQLVSGDKFTIDVEVFNLNDLRLAELQLLFQSNLIRIDSVRKGTSLDVSDALLAVLGDVSVPYIRVTDTTMTGLIVDENGYSHLARLYVSAGVTDIAAAASLETMPTTFLLVDGSQVPVSNIGLRNCYVYMDAFPDRIITPFDDPQLEQAVRAAIFDQTTNPIYLSQVWHVTYLNGADLAIQSLAGIENLPNLQAVYMPWNQIVDLAPLAELPDLWYLVLDDNNNFGTPSITDFSPLASMTRLQHLSLVNTHFANTHLSHLTTLTRLTYLNLSNNDYTGNDITDLQPLTGLTNLDTLHLSGNFNLSDVAPISSMANIRYLSLDYCNIIDATPLVSGTIFESVAKLMPGQCAVVEDGAVRIDYYWQLQYCDRSSEREEALRREFRGLLRECVGRAAPDGDAGTFLSGGTDSSTVTGTLTELRHSPADTYSIGFEAEGYDEMQYARIASRHFGSRAHEYYVTPRDVADAIGPIAGAYDEPFGNASAVPTYYCAKLARDDGRDLLLAGDGGDEIFGGYRRYFRESAKSRARGMLPGPV
ncbi:MAG: leucine-rich repeat domain-containing protein, partial [Candidatus Zixiibacteriota bacterium]